MGKIEVTVQTEQRLEAITALAHAVEQLSRALGIGTHVHVTGNTITNGMKVHITEDVTETRILEVPDE